MGLPDPQSSRVVLIGTSKYTDEKLPDLPAVKSTVTSLETAFTDPNYGVVPKSNCVVLIDEGDIRLLGRRLRTAAKQADDLLLVFYAGHGLVGGRRHELYLGLPDSEWVEPEFNSLDYDKLRGAILDSPAATKIMILDCCFSGRVVSDTMADQATALVSQMEVDGTYVLTSAQRDQVALVVPGEEHTAFTGRFLRLLKEGVPEGPEFLTIEDIYRQLLVKMKAEGLSEPQKRATRTADLLALTSNRAFAGTAGPALRQRQAAAFEQGERGDWDRAAALLRDILQDQTRILGSEHQDTLRTRQFLAHAVGGAGDPVEAVGSLRKLLAEQTLLLGSDHEDTLQTRQYLAVNLGESGYREEAVAILRVLLPDRRRLLGSEDPRTLRTAHMLARYLALTNVVGEASALLREVVAVRERTLGGDHPHTMRARRDLSELHDEKLKETNV